MEENNKEGAESLTIAARQNGHKEAVIKALRETPIIQYACKRADIGRTTFYRFYRDDPAFAKAADEAIAEGASMVSDLAESQLIAAIRDRDVGAIKYWLSHHHKSYTAKLHVTTELSESNKELTSEQKVLIERAIELAGFEDRDATDNKNGEEKDAGAEPVAASN